jgi:ribonuclease D
MERDTPRTQSGDQGRIGGPAARWIASEEALAGTLAEVGGGPLALDTEADSFHRYRERVCLIQLSFGDCDALVDPLAGIDLAPLGRLLEDPALPKVMHGADYDVRLLSREASLGVRGLFDTMVAARLVGERAFGLAALVEKYLGVALDKKHQRADWAVRPLPAAMLRYAVDDTRYLLPLAAKLRERLMTLGRMAWAEEEFRQVERARWKSEEPNLEPWLRLKRLRDVPRPRLAVLREVAALRDATARRLDLPPFRVARDEVLIELARVAPRDAKALAAIRGIPRAWGEGQGAAAWLAAVARGLALDPAGGPMLPPPRERVRRTPEQEARLARLLRGRDRIAAALDLEPAVVASRSQLEPLAGATGAVTPAGETICLRAWQRSLLADAIAEA